MSRRRDDVDWSKMLRLSVVLAALPSPEPALTAERMEVLRDLARAGRTPEQILATLTPAEMAELPY